MDNLSFVKKNFLHYVNKIIDNHKISHTYLIEIDDYDNDLKFVYDFVKMIILNLNYSDMIQSKSPIISLIDNHNYPDIKVIEPEGYTIKKSQLMELQKDYSNKSLLGGKRIYLIKNSEKLNVSSANTMLKFLEEPEDNIIAILLTDNRYHVIDTILSRCQVLTLKEDVFHLDFDNNILDFINYLKFPSNFFVEYNHFFNDIFVDKNTTKNFLCEIENLILSYFNYEYGISGSNNEYVKLLKDISNDKLLIYLSIFEDEIQKLDFNVNFKLWLDSFFSRLILGG